MKASSSATRRLLRQACAVAICSSGQLLSWRGSGLSAAHGFAVRQLHTTRTNNAPMIPHRQQHRRHHLVRRHLSSDVVVGAEQENAATTATTTKASVRRNKTPRVYKHLYRHYEDISIDCWLRCSDPREFLLSCGYTDSDVDRIADEYPQLLDLDVHDQLAPKVRFIVGAIRGGAGDLTWSDDGDGADLPYDGEECDVIDTSPHQLRVSKVAKKFIPPSFFGHRGIERTVGPRHAYLQHFGLPHGERLFYSGGKRLGEFLDACQMRSSPAEFAVLCMRWTVDDTRVMGGTTFGSAVHTSDRVAAFERAFHGGLLAAARNELTDELTMVGCSPGRMVGLLVDHGANHMEPDRHGASALHWAAGTGNEEGVRVLLDVHSSAYEGVGDDDGSSVDSTPPFGVEVVLNAQGAKDGATPLHWACCGVGPDGGFGTGGHVGVCRHFLDMAGERSGQERLANAKTMISKTTPIMWAAWSGSLDVAKLLISRGADPHFRNGNGCNVAHWSASGGSLDMCTYLRDELGVDFTEKNDAGRTPLYHAITYGHLEVVEWIVDTFYSDANNDDGPGSPILTQEEELLARLPSSSTGCRPGDDSRRALLDDVLGDSVDA